MEIKLFNTLTRRKEDFKPLKDKRVGLYTCGPTVYWYQHIGNLRSYVFSDLLKRVLLFNGYKVKHVMNITDVGHLTSNADEGEDKMEVATKKEGKKAGEIADYYWRIFKQDFKKLNIIEPNIWCKATEHIKEQIEMVKKLEQKGDTYKTSDGLYFDTSRVKDYGQLSTLKDIKEGARVEKNPEKKNPSDFALWKFSEKPGVRQQEWDSPWGLGFPGWHLECSAMSSKYLGEQFDIHTGGEDHIAIHHPNEIAQSEGAFGKKPWVKYWMHGAFLTFKGEKVSKSKGGLYTISELAEQGFEPLAYRYLCLMTHYRKPLSFSLASLKAAQDGLNNLRRELPDDKGKVLKKYLDDFTAAVNDDLNLPKSLGVLRRVIKSKEIGRRATINEFDKVLGLGLNEVRQTKIPQVVLKLAEERETARQERDWSRADELRKKIEKLGYIIEDTTDSSRVIKK